MAYTYGAAKQVPVQGITFHVKLGWADWNEIQKQIGQLALDASRFSEAQEDLTESEQAKQQRELEERSLALEQKLIGHVVGWEGVVSGCGEPMAFSSEALLGQGDYVDQGIDVAIVAELVSRINEQGEQVKAEIAEENPT